MAGQNRFDFFDVDHTIIRGSSGPLFLLKGVQRGLFPVLTLAYIPFFFLQYYTGSLHASSRDWHFSVLTGQTRQALEEVAWGNSDRLIALIYPGARSLIKQLKAAGHRVVLATSSLDLIVRPLAEHLGIEEVIATSLEFESDRCTGRFVDGPLLKEKKREKVYDFIRAQGGNWQDCAFYSDSINDISLLESVADPVAVNPDLRLRLVARKRGWRTLRFR
jgi:HAD superfamily hydrolase (TIGR01490 family)